VLEIGESEFLNLRRLPACCTLQQAAWLLGISLKAAAYLVSIGLLKVLGHPAPNAPKSLSAEYVLSLSRDPHWLGKAHDAIRKYNYTRNHQSQEVNND
jgi:hypothetical protein